MGPVSPGSVPATLVQADAAFLPQGAEQARLDIDGGREIMALTLRHGLIPESETRMFPVSLSRFCLAAALGLLLATAGYSQSPYCQSCRPSTSSGRQTVQDPAYDMCKGLCKSKYSPPSIHPGTTFGYYPTNWSPWPCAQWANGRHLSPPDQTPVPPLAPTGPEVEPLPPPRPTEARRMPVGGPRLPSINPAIYHSPQR
jgi:hypothetical protein